MNDLPVTLASVRDAAAAIAGAIAHSPVIASPALAELAGRSKAVALQHHGGTKGLGAVDLDERCALGHHDRRRNT